MLRSVVVLRCKCLPLLRLAGLRVLKVVRPNNSFKPNLLRYSNNMAGKACHVLASTTQVGLIQALGLMHKLVATAVLLSAVLGGCATAPVSAPETLGEIGNRVARKLCSVSVVTVKPVPNQHIDGQMDRLETRQCPIGSSTFYRGATTSDPDGLPLTVELVAKGVGLPPHLEIGEPIGPAMRALGTPQEQDLGSFTYGLSVEGSDTATIHHAAGRITSVRWVWVVD